jgi:hypothetical protein
MKTHAWFAERLAVYRDLDDADRSDVDRHLRECMDCAARLAEYQEMDRALAALARPRPDRRLREGFYAVAERHGQGGSRWEELRFWLSGLPVLAGRAVELAVVALVLAGLGFTLRTWLRAPAALPPFSTTTVSDGTQDLDLGSGLPAEDGMSGGYAMDRPDAQVFALDAAESPNHPASLFSAQAVAIPLPQAGEEDGRAYIVQANDTLWKLALQYLGDGHRFREIIEATNAKHEQDSSFARIDDANRIEVGSKLWIPGEAPGQSGAQAATRATPAAARPAPSGTGPAGHLAFSFWNDHPARCTYEINVLDVAACRRGAQACQANRLIFPLNNVSEPALSPGGTRIAFRGWGEPPSEDSPYLNCATPINARGVVNTTLDGTEFKRVSTYWEDGHPDWSPDGGQILFDTGRHPDEITRIMLENADGSDERDLRIAGQHPSWAPDGQRFVYRGCDLTGNRCGLWLAYAAPVKSWEAGSNMIGPVVQDAPAAHPDWSPVSDEIVYQSPASGGWDLYVARADGTGQSGGRRLTDDPAIEGLPSWSPDGQWIAYLSNAGGNWGIWIVRADGTQRQLLFSFDGGGFTPLAVEPYGQRDWIDEQISWSP